MGSIKAVAKPGENRGRRCSGWDNPEGPVCAAIGLPASFLCGGSTTDHLLCNKAGLSRLSLWSHVNNRA